MTSASASATSEPAKTVGAASPGEVEAVARSEPIQRSVVAARERMREIDRDALATRDAEAKRMRLLREAATKRCIEDAPECVNRELALQRAHHPERRVITIDVERVVSLDADTAPVVAWVLREYTSAGWHVRVTRRRIGRQTHEEFEFSQRAFLAPSYLVPWLWRKFLQGAPA